MRKWCGAKWVLGVTLAVSCGETLLLVVIVIANFTLAVTHCWTLAAVGFEARVVSFYLSSRYQIVALVADRGLW
ncbi:MAG: hypothetical protein ACRCVV_03995 [Shewanella sp.]